MKNLKITKEFLLQEYFQNRKTQKQIASDLGCHVGTIEKYMSIYELTHKSLDRYTIKQHLMVETDPYFMYAVGLFVTDGSIDKTGRLSIRINDEDVIKVLCKYFDCPYYHCRKDKKVAQHEFNIPINTPLTEYCNKLSPDNSTKTFNVELPEVEKEALKLMLLRGIIDGDGSIRDNCTDIRIFTASVRMCISLKNLFKDLNIEVSSNPTIYGKHKKVGWTVYVPKHAATPALIRIYQDYPHIAIQRKRNVVKNKVDDIVRTYEMINRMKW